MDVDKWVDEEVIEDEVPEVTENPVSKLGEVYQLGRHRLLCGDSTKIEDVEKLMDGQKADMVFTDPPYGIDLDTDYSGMPSRWNNKNMYQNKFKKVEGDSKPFNATHLFNFGTKEVFLWGADYYANTLPDGGVNGTYFVWDKREAENFDKMLGSPYELCWSKQKHKKEFIRMRWASFLHGQATEGEQSKNRVHPTQKPQALASWFYKKFSKENDIIVDLYGGSGSFLIACEQTNRICYGMEIDPRYCDVIRKRYAKFIGKEEEWQTVTPKIN
jgi:DNA modification methylase